MDQRPRHGFAMRASRRQREGVILVLHAHRKQTRLSRVLARDQIAEDRGVVEDGLDLPAHQEIEDRTCVVPGFVADPPLVEPASGDAALDCADAHPREFGRRIEPRVQVRHGQRGGDRAGDGGDQDEAREHPEQGDGPPDGSDGRLVAIADGGHRDGRPPDAVAEPQDALGEILSVVPPLDEPYQNAGHGEEEHCQAEDPNHPPAQQAGDVLAPSGLPLWLRRDAQPGPIEGMAEVDALLAIGCHVEGPNRELDLSRRDRVPKSLLRVGPQLVLDSQLLRDLIPQRDAETPEGAVRPLDHEGRRGARCHDPARTAGARHLGHRDREQDGRDRDPEPVTKRPCHDGAEGTRGAPGCKEAASRALTASCSKNTLPEIAKTQLTWNERCQHLDPTWMTPGGRDGIDRLAEAHQ